MAMIPWCWRQTPWLAILIPVVMALTIATAQAAIEVQDFDDPGLTQRYDDLTSRLRCPKCQNESIAASNSPISADMRARVAALLRQGQSDQQIEDVMVSRFGDYALYDPRLDTRTWLLWSLPFALVLIGGCVVAGFVICRRRRDHQASAAHGLDDQERQRLEALMSQHSSGGDSPQSPHKEPS